MIYVCGKAGAGVKEAVLPIPPASIMNEDGAGTGIEEAVLPIPPAMMKHWGRC